MRPDCETDVSLWSLLIKATMTFKGEFEFDEMQKMSPSIYNMTFQDFHPISFFCTVKHYGAQEAYFPSHSVWIQIEKNETYDYTIMNS